LPCSQDEERLRAIYEKKFKRLKTLDNIGAESSKIDATRASVRKLQTKINICIRTAETIMGRIHKLRDNELQPQLAALINGYQIASLIHYAIFICHFLLISGHKHLNFLPENTVKRLFFVVISRGNVFGLSSSL